MHVTVVRPSELGPDEARLWAKFQQVSPMTLNPFFSLTFAQTVGRARSNARIAVVEDGDQIEAFLPFELASMREALPIGYPVNNLHGFISSGAPVDARWVVRKAGLRGWRFISAPADQLALAPHQYGGTTVQAPEINLATGYESKLSSRRKARRAIERRLGPIEFEWHSSHPEHLRQLFEWKARKYAGTRKLFSSDPTAFRIVEELTATVNEECQGILSVLSGGEQPIAIHLGLLGPRALSGWFTSYDPGLRALGPGMVMWRTLAEAAAAKSIGRIDLGSGQDKYKFNIANDSYPVAGGAVWASRAEAAARSIYRQVRRHQPGSIARVPSRTYRSRGRQV